MPSDFSMYIFFLNSSLQLFGLFVEMIKQWYVPRYGG
jgi:hypothetical protein